MKNIQILLRVFLLFSLFNLFLGLLWGAGEDSQEPELLTEEAESLSDSLNPEELNLGDDTDLLFDLTNQNFTLTPEEMTNFTQSEVDALLNRSNAVDMVEEVSPEVVPVVKKPIEGWGGLKLGLTYDEVIAVLTNEYPWMVLRPQEYQGEEVNPDRIFFLESFKNDFFTKVQFQLDKEQRLYLLRLEMNPRYFSFPKLYNRLFDLYGPPQENSYLRVTWKDATRSLDLYRNNTVVYLEKAGWEEVLPKSQIEDQRQKLLDSVFDNL